uniref:Uncharacterized protein n=1 Tax=Arundo donax TaxID=35708 RepID=A0A0A9B5L8_ARUDO
MSNLSLYCLSKFSIFFVTPPFIFLFCFYSVYNMAFP